MKILMIIGQYHPVSGGAEKECQKVSRRLQREGMAVTVLTQSCEGLPGYEVIDEIPVYRKMGGWHLYEYTYMLSVLWFLLKHFREYDIIQCFGLYLFIPPVALMNYLFKKRAIARIEGPGSSGDFHRIRNLRCGKLILGSAKTLDRIISISADIGLEIKENGFPDHAVVSIPNSVDVEHFQPGENAGRGKAGNICYVGRLAEEKGVRYLIRAMKGIKKEWEGIKLFIVGDGPIRSGLEDLSRQLGLTEEITFAGNTDTVLSYYQKAEIFVLPSLSEGLPLSLLEALSCGLPVIATAVGGNREILDPDYAGEAIPVSNYRVGEFGLLVNPEDVEGLEGAVLRLLRDGALSNQMRRRVRSYVQQNYGVDRVIGQYRELYSGLAGNG